MAQDSQSNQGFSDQQKQELTEIFGDAIKTTVPPIVEEIVERKTAPYFQAIKKDLDIAQQERQEIRNDLSSLKQETAQNFEEAAEHREVLANKLKSHQQMLDTHDRILHPAKK